MSTDTSRLIAATEFAELLGCSVPHIHNLDASGICPPHTKLGGLKRWVRSAVEDWIESGCADERLQKRKAGDELLARLIAARKAGNREVEITVQERLQEQGIKIEFATPPKSKEVRDDDAK